MSRDAQGHTPSEHGGTDCSQTLFRMYEYLDGEMSKDDTAAIAAHLAECGPCLAEHDRERLIKAMLQRACRVESAPAELRVRIVQRLTTIRFES